MSAPLPKIVFLDRATIPAATTVRAPKSPHQLVVHERTAPEETAARIAGATVVVTNKVRIPREAMAGAPDLRLIAVAATGTDVIDLAAARELGIAVSNIRDYALHTVPEHVFAMMLALRRSLLEYRNSVAAGRWQDAGLFCYFDYPIKDLAGSTLGVIGSGVLGGEVARLGEAFRMRVLHAERKGVGEARPGRVPFEQVLRESDVISLHLPLSPASRNLIGAPEFALMERRPLLINAGRGGLVDETALGAALDSGLITGAGFDVVTTEPPPADHPFMALLDRPNFLLTPHVAWAGEEATQVLADQLIDNIDAFFEGTPRNLV